MWAIISDIHANLEAFLAVLEDIERHKVERILCLGDIVGYGPNPIECLDLVMKKAEFSVLGNHDQGALFDPNGWSPAAERAILWTRDELERRPPGRAGELADERWEYLSALQRTHREGPYLLVHGSARNPVNEDVFPEDIYHQRKMEARATRTSPASSSSKCRRTYTGSTARRRSSTPTTSTAARRCATSARSASRATATHGPATSCSTATRSASAACRTTSRRRARRSTTTPNSTTSSATAYARDAEPEN